MHAKDAILMVVEGRTPYGWETTRGVYANLSNWPNEIKYYIRCPRCGLVHDGGTTLKDTAEMKLCTGCNMDVINKLKDEVQKVVHDPEHKPKEMMKLVGEALEDDPDAVNPAYISELPDRVDFLAGKLKAKTATQAEAVEYAIIQAESVLPIFEKEYPDDPRPRRAIEAANRWLRDPSEANRLAAFAADAAADADAAAAAAADAAAGAFATYAAAYAAFATYAAAYTANFLYWAEQAAYCAADAKKQAGIEESQEEEDTPTDPFDAPLTNTFGVPIPPEDEPSTGEFERMYFSNWIITARNDFAVAENISFEDQTIDDRWSEREGSYDESDPDATTAFKIECGDHSWCIFKDEDALHAYGEKCCRAQLELEPEIFNKDFVKNWIDTSKLLAAIGDPYEDWEYEEVDNLDYDELLAKMVEEGFVESDDAAFFKQNGDPRIKNPVRDKALDVIKARFVEERKPQVEDPWGWLSEIYSDEDALKFALDNAGIDVDKAVKECLASDGALHFCSSYDGHQRDLEHGAVYFREN